MAQAAGASSSGSSKQSKSMRGAAGGEGGSRRAHAGWTLPAGRGGDNSEDRNVGCGSTRGTTVCVSGNLDLGMSCSTKTNLSIELLSALTLRC